MAAPTLEKATSRSTDGEPSLGWTDEEAAPGTPMPAHSASARTSRMRPQRSPRPPRNRYRQFDRYSVNDGGWHVVSEHWFKRRIRNLSDRQRRLVRAKIDRSQVSC